MVIIYDVKRENNFIVYMNMDSEDLIKTSPADSEFDTVVGHIEDIIIGQQFSDLHHSFMEKYYMIFEKKEENKLEYMDVFNEYTNTIENYLEIKLTERIPTFSMEGFLRQLRSKQDELEGEVFELLLSFTNFLTLKEIFLDYKDFKEGNSINLFLSGTIPSSS